MSTDFGGPDYKIVRTTQLQPVACPCGMTRRAFADDPDRIASLHVVDISEDARAHYHKKLTEIYYILQGKGEMELNGKRYPVSVGDAILIKPGCRHRAIGAMKIINIPIPAFDPDDEWFED